MLLTVVFLLMRVAPGDPITAALGGQLSAADSRSGEPPPGFDRPLLHAVLGLHLGTSCALDFGTTITDNQTIVSASSSRTAARRSS